MNMLLKPGGTSNRNALIALYSSFADFLTDLPQVKLDIQLVRKEDFGDFFEQLIIYVSKARAERKLKAFRNLLVDQMTAQQDIDLAETFLSVIF